MTEIKDQEQRYLNKAKTILEYFIDEDFDTPETIRAKFHIQIPKYGVWCDKFLIPVNVCKQIINYEKCLKGESFNLKESLN